MVTLTIFRPFLMSAIGLVITFSNNVNQFYKIIFMVIKPLKFIIANVASSPVYKQIGRAHV